MSVPSGVEDMFIFRNKNISGENVSTSRGNTVGQLGYNSNRILSTKSNSIPFSNNRKQNQNGIA